MNSISGTRVLMLATDGFADPELYEPLEALRSVGVEVTLASPETRPIVGVSWDEQAGRSSPSTLSITPDLNLEEAVGLPFDALLLPGGAANAASLRNEPEALAIVRRYVDEGRPVAAICHAVSLLVEAQALRGRRATAWASVQPELAAAGAHVLDEPVVVDGNLITSRKPADVPAFTDALCKALAATRS